MLRRALSLVFWVFLVVSSIVLFPVALVLGGSLAVAMDWLIYRRLRQRTPDKSSAELATLIGSIGVASILTGYVFPL